MRESYPFFLAGEATMGAASIDITNKYTLRKATTAAATTREQVELAIARASGAEDDMRRLPAHARRAALLHVARRLEELRESFARAMTVEVGKPIRYSRAEVDRAVDTFTASAEEATRQYGEFTPLDVSPRGDGYQAIIRRAPVGACSFITPFNFPLNLAAHKVAPAIACGCPFVLKPDERTPVTTLMLGEILAETDLPAGSWSIVLPEGDARDPLADDDRLKFLSFTGSPKVGWALKAKSGRKRVALELGGNAACIVDAGTDVERAAERIAIGAYHQAGQSCISVQRILAHASVIDDLRAALIARISALVVGDPMKDATDVGPVIAEAHAARIEEWVNEAAERGATIAAGGGRDGVMAQPTLLENTPHDARVSCDEVFGPVATLEPFEAFDDALRIADDSVYGLQAGVFTPDLERAMRAFDALRVGGVVVNDVPTSRVDVMPYGGVRQSGIGREGPRYAIEDMTEPKVLLIRRG